MIKQEKIQETLLRLCKHYGEQNWWQSDNKLEDLVSTILIQRTTEKNAKLALAGLMDVMTPGFTARRVTGTYSTCWIF